jgi:hypothetical protein
LDVRKGGDNGFTGRGLRIMKEGGREGGRKREGWREGGVRCGV